MGKDPLTDYGRTQRVVFLIDLNPLLHLQDPIPYLTTLLSSTKTLLSFPPLSDSLFSFRPFFSSLSPLLSSSKLLTFPSSLFLSFDLPDSTFLSLSRFLNSLKDSLLFSNSGSSSTTLSRGCHIAASMRQLVHDYAWDPVVRDPGMGKVLDFHNSVFVRSNMVVLFSPICKDLNSLSLFLNVGVNDECLRDVSLFKLKFRGVFESVNDAFVTEDIHLSWVDVKYESGSTESNMEMGDSGLKSGLFQCGIMDLGWGFCSTDSIVYGSALVPFGLIYPRIGISSNFFGFDDSRERIRVHLSLEILDVNGKPLKCKYSGLEFVDSKVGFSCGQDELINLETGSNEQNRKSLVELFCGEFAKLHVKEVRKHDECVKIEGHLSDPLIVCESWGDSGSDLKENSKEFYADRVLQMLANEIGENALRKHVPFWQIFLSFLYREGYWALVSLSNGNDNLCMGVLKPFTVSSALLSIINDGLYSQIVQQELGGSNVKKPGNVDLKLSSELVESKSRLSSHGKHDIQKGDRRKTHKKELHLLQDLTWDAFCKAASDDSEIYLEDVYFTREYNSLKKLKFLKCWMKQIKKSTDSSWVMLQSSQPHEDISKEISQRVTELPQQSEQSIPLCASVGENSLTEASEKKDTSYSQSETWESFVSVLPNKIQQALESEEVDMGSFAERLVDSSIFWFCCKYERESNCKSKIPVLKSEDACSTIIADELNALLLKDPKDLASTCKKKDLSSKASVPDPTGAASPNRVREYELQIFFRMEILRSEIGAIIEESMKQKFVKQICLLLEAIQCHLEGGFFGDWSLDNYVGKTLKSRYCHTLRDVVHRIYAKMDLLLFDQDESPNDLLHSEDSNQSWRDKQGNDLIDDKYGIAQPVSDESLPLRENGDENCQGIQREGHASKLIEARRRRERARRFASFTSWMPDLQRVWAPKQTKAVKPRSDPAEKLSKRKEHRRTSYDTVSETPLAGNKRSCRQVNCIDDEDHRNDGPQSGRSVPRALFQDAP